MLAKALFWGAVWGLGEATLGHVLHLVRIPGLPGLVMAPFAVVVLGRVAARSRSAGAVFLAGLVAASFKLFDLLVPGTDILALVNPIQAILKDEDAHIDGIEEIQDQIAQMGVQIFLTTQVG
ncbi:MAG: hypothetical protein ACXWF4_05970 [Candidatus Aminicenantales bacterium]